MKRLLIADMHGKDPINFIGNMQVLHGIEKVFLLGDYDKPEILESLLELDIKKEILAGNHDYDFANGNVVLSNLLTYSPQEYIQMWNEHAKAKEYILKSDLQIIEELKGRKIVYVHGALVNSNPNKNPHLWGRIKHKNPAIEEGKARENFVEMFNNDYGIMIRAHDHKPQLFSIDYNSDPNDSNSKIQVEKTPIIFQENRRYIVSIGIFREDQFAIMDDNNMSLKFYDRVE